MATNMQYLKKRLKQKQMGGRLKKIPAGAGGSERAPITGAGGVPRPVSPRGGGKLTRVYGGANIEKYRKGFKKSQKLAPPANIQPGAVPTGQEHKMRHEFKESVAKRHKLNKKLITARYGKSRDWHKRLYGAGYKEGTVGRLGTKIGAQRAHVYGQKASIYKLGKKLKGLEAKTKPAEGEEAAEPSDRAKALTKRISQLEKNLKVSSKNLGTTKAEKQKYIDKRNKMLQHLYTLSRSKPGSLGQARKAEAEGRLKKARYNAPGPDRSRGMPKGGRGRGMPKHMPGGPPIKEKPGGPSKGKPGVKYQKQPNRAFEGKTDELRTISGGRRRGRVRVNATIRARQNYRARLKALRAARNRRRRAKR